MYFNGPESIISRLLSLVRVEERKISEWVKVFREISPKGFKWRAAWIPPRPMALRCSDFNGVPLVSHARSTTYFPARVVRQLGGLQTVLENTARTKFKHIWLEDQTSVDRQNSIQQVLAAWLTVAPKHLYFPEYPTHEERDFQATEEYVLRFYRWGIQAELANLRVERDYLRREIAEKNEQLVDQHQLQKELAQARAQLQRRDQEFAQANAALERSRKRARGGPHTLG
ncbi:hypothetical protein CRG98_011239 [Punica granatum]|uniref:DUF7745 domain-containing protein n=1 Tax=Punica granatum TaxID=22663 RepID=A0A2I0KIM3_PUNGR|nr:hypothetical protein CRG98_011239 [Punica granatum]